MPKTLSRRGAIAATALVLAVLASALAAGCGSSGRAANGSSAIAVTERDFHISAPSRLSSGEVVFSVHNEGPDRHEFIIASAGSSPLPLRADGLTINEEVLQKREVGELEPGAPGSVRTLRLHLRPGRYVFFCNMAGHYLGGMHHEVVVQ